MKTNEKCGENTTKEIDYRKAAKGVKENPIKGDIDFVKESSLNGFF